MINFKNVFFTSQFKKFLFHGKAMFCSWDIQSYILNHSNKMSVSTQGRLHFWIYLYFWIYLLNRNHLDMKLDQIKDTAMGNNSKNNFAWFSWLGPIFKYFFIWQPTAVNQKTIMMSTFIFILLKVRNETMKNSKHCLLKITRLLYTAILPK